MEGMGKSSCWVWWLQGWSLLRWSLQWWSLLSQCLQRYRIRARRSPAEVGAAQKILIKNCSINLFSHNSLRNWWKLLSWNKVLQAQSFPFCQIRFAHTNNTSSDRNVGEVRQHLSEARSQVCRSLIHSHEVGK